MYAIPGVYMEFLVAPMGEGCANPECDDSS